ncbi:MAG: class II aldolase/adducin family protein [Clostridia bacterium]|nr:class II aldolase/adducin family protein [Clostridia bacterium]
MNFELLHPADQIVMTMNRIYAGGMTTTSGGNLSVRDQEGNIWITPASIDKGSLTRADIMQVKPDGTVIGPHRPSVELPVHRNIYQLRPDINAIVHAHPASMVAFSLVRHTPDMQLLPSVYHICGEIGMVGYNFPGSPGLQRDLAAAYAAGCSTALMDNHGVICGAADLQRAYMMFETVTNFGRTEILARKLGEPRSLSLEEIALDSETMPELGVLDPEAPSNEECAARRDMAAFIRRACDQKLFTAAFGTFSMRLPDNSLLITPHGMDRRYLEAEDLVRVKDGKCEAGKLPSRSVLLHEKIYAKNPELNCVIIAQPVNTMAFAVTGAEFNTYFVPETYVSLRNVARLPYAACNRDIEATAAAISAKTPVLIVDNQCAIVAGTNLLSAFDHLEVLEFTADAVISAKDLGEIVLITKDEMQELVDAFGL